MTWQGSSCWRQRVVRRKTALKMDTSGLSVKVTTLILGRTRWRHGAAKLFDDPEVYPRAVRSQMFRTVAENQRQVGLL